MKRIMVLVAVILSLAVPVIAGDKEFEPQRFQVTYKITYNSMTLEQAAKMEEAIKTTYKGACKIKVILEENDTIVFTNSGTWIPLTTTGDAK